MLQQLSTSRRFRANLATAATDQLTLDAAHFSAVEPTIMLYTNYTTLL